MLFEFGDQLFEELLLRFLFGYSCMLLLRQCWDPGRYTYCSAILFVVIFDVRNVFDGSSEWDLISCIVVLEGCCKELGFIIDAEKVLETMSTLRIWPDVARHLAVYGEETMRKLFGFNVLNSGMNGLNAEIAKNLVLAGVVVLIDATLKDVEFDDYCRSQNPSIAFIKTEIRGNAVRGDEEPIALQAIEFWNSICDVEIEIQGNSVDLDGGFSSEPYYHFIEKALPSLVPMLLETLLKQEEDQDQDDSVWNLSMAGGTCLGLVARTVGDDIVPLVIPFVELNIAKPDWRSREAATFAFGSVLEGPSVEKLQPLVQAGLDFLLNAMKDQNSHVKDTTAWSLSRIFEILHSPGSGYSVINSENIRRIVGVLLESITDAPNVAEKVCGAIYFLAQGFEVAGSSSASLLSPYLFDIISSLIATADRTSGNDDRLRTSAYETLNAVVRCSNLSETSPIIAQLLPVIMAKLSNTIELQILSADDREKQGSLQASLCGLLLVIIHKLSSYEETKTIILQLADQMMVLFLQVFACRSATVHEEAMLAIGALAYAAGPVFIKYMSEFYKYLEMGLQNFEEYQVCSISVGVVGDICRALDDKVLPFCDGIMTLLLKDLSSSMLHRSVKPPIFSCFGDIALAIGEQFERYLVCAISMLQAASELCARFDVVDEEMHDYGNQLRRGIFEAYSGILQGLKSTKAELMVPHAALLLQFIEAVFQDKGRDDSVTKAAVAVIGDLADTLGPNIKILLTARTFYSEFLLECMESDDDQLKETATWTQGMIGRVLVS